MTMRDHPTSLDKGRSSEKQMKVVIIYETSWPVPLIPSLILAYLWVNYSCGGILMKCGRYLMSIKSGPVASYCSYRDQ